MKYLIIALCAIVMSLAFAGRKCEHKFVSVEQAEIKIDEPEWSRIDDLMPAWTKRPTGKQEGKELVCVRCLHVQKQILDYGKPEQAGPTLGSLGWPRNSQINAGPCYDSLFFMSSSGLIIDSTPNKIVARKGKAVYCLEAPAVHECGVYWYTDSDRAILKRYNDSVALRKDNKKAHRY